MSRWSAGGRSEPPAVLPQQPPSSLHPKNSHPFSPKKVSCSPLPPEARRRGQRHGNKVNLANLERSEGRCEGPLPKVKTRWKSQTGLQPRLRLSPPARAARTPCIKSFMHTTCISHQLLSCKAPRRRRACKRTPTRWLLAEASAGPAARAPARPEG